jgi:Protein of unknown function (DUF2950)
VAAARSQDTAALRAVLGPGSKALISSGDRFADETAQRRFVEAFDIKHAIVPRDDHRMGLDVGANEWELPIPIVERGGRFYFDSREGAQEVVDRRIGGNEIAAIRVALAYVDSQDDYFKRRRQTGTGEYARRIVSTQGKHDGLYWPKADGQEDSPLEPLFAQARDEGYPGEMGKCCPIRAICFASCTPRVPSRRTAQKIRAERSDDRRICVDRLVGELRVVGYHELHRKLGRRRIPKGPRTRDRATGRKYH